MEDILISLLETFKVPVYRQGSVSESAYPDLFITFWHRDTQSLNFYDNGGDYATAETFDVNVYGTDPGTVYGLLESVVTTLWANGWTIPDRGHDVASDNQSHIGRGIAASKRKENQADV